MKLLIRCVDLIIIMLVFSFLIYVFISLIENLFKLSLNNELLIYMVDNSKNIYNQITNVQVILLRSQLWEGSWSSGIRNLFIYGTSGTAHVNVESGSITSISNNFISDGNGLDDFYNKIVAYIMNILKPILEPVKVSYSNELLATQLYGISILLFILSILIIIMLIGFIVNFLIYINSDRIIIYFNNKYIKWYVNFNKKIIGIELLFLGSSILYSMYTLSYGLHFLATHPITFN